MKKTFLKISILFFALVFVTSCSSDDDGPTEAATVKFRATVGGQNLRTDNVSGVLSNNGGRLTVAAVTDFGSITISVGSGDVDAPAVTNQTYVINNTGTAGITLNSGGAIYTSNADLGGEIIITNIDLTENTVFGSFNTTLVNTLDSEDTLTVTNSSLFNVGFTVD
ncbi:DUF6252 family protein [uncultured Dokdonia sp.]|uniref:DUF6252 family protein n=1 Tax=uncultured Dokdonia sp. TaxID=575653 RepID=UPI00262FAA33|nr:DUF6252 family protein [uncultured Dokdonia sp.]